VRRESGKYKVPITPEELMDMSVEDYQALCSQPREAPPLAEPVLSQKLAVLYAKAEAKIEAASKKSIALQVTITANALGKTEEQMLAACEGLIEKHQSDSTRYNMSAKRREELKRLYAYTPGNPT
jgi:hypothetical protein